MGIWQIKNSEYYYSNKFYLLVNIIMRNWPTARIENKSIEDQIKDIEQKIQEAKGKIPQDNTLLNKLGLDLSKLLSQKTKPAEAPEEKKQDYSELFELLIKAWIIPASMEKKILQKQLAEAELRRSWQTEQVISKQSKDDIIKQLKESLNQKDTAINDLAMTKETLINHEFLKHRRLKNMYKRIQKMKNKWDNGKNAVIYFMAMESRHNGWKIQATLNRWIMKAGFFNTENVKREMATCLARYAEKDWDSEKTKALKRIVYAEIKTITNDYLKNVTTANIIK